MKYLLAHRFYFQHKGTDLSCECKNEFIFKGIIQNSAMSLKEIASIFQNQEQYRKRVEALDYGYKLSELCLKFIHQPCATRHVTFHRMDNVANAVQREF